MKQTNWFKGSVKPVRKGVYKRLWREPNGGYKAVFTHWNGKFWGQSSLSVDLASLIQTKRGICQNLAWCGLAQDPEVK